MAEEFEVEHEMKDRHPQQRKAAGQIDDDQPMACAFLQDSSPAAASLPAFLGPFPPDHKRNTPPRPAIRDLSQIDFPRRLCAHHDREPGRSVSFARQMPADYDDQNALAAIAETLTGGRQGVTSHAHVTELASEVLRQVARRAVDRRRRKDQAAVLAAAFAVTTGSEQEAVAALESLDDPLNGLDWFLAERLGPIAKEIGALWNSDKISFLEATVGASRIYSHLRYRRRPPLMPDRGMRKSATFALVPGDMHTLGISAATDVFRSRGWDITLLIGQSHDELNAHFETSQDLLFGFSAGSDHSLAALGRLVVALTVARPAALVLVSGQIAADPGAILALPGVDFCAAEMDGASRWLESQVMAHPG